MTSAQIGDVRIEYVVDGPDDGEPMLLIMGMGAQAVAWPQDLVDLLVERGFRVVRYDNRDQGLSSFTDAPAPTRGDIARGLAARRLARSDYTLGDLAADAAGLLEHLGIASAHVVGASMGGMIAQEAHRHPTRDGAIALLDHVQHRSPALRTDVGQGASRAAAPDPREPATHP